jgi:hypothetical protein
MPITVQKGGRPSAIVSIKAALAQLPLDTELAPILKRLGEGEEVTVQTRDGDEAILTLLNAKANHQVPAKLPARDRVYSARCKIFVPLSATVRVKATDEQFAKERIIDALRGNSSPSRREFLATVDFDEFEQLFTHVEHYGSVPSGMIRHLDFVSIEEIKPLGRDGL